APNEQETSPPHIPASGRGRRSAAGHVTRRLGAKLSVAAGAVRRRLCARRRRPRHAPDGSVAVRTARAAVRGPEPGRGRPYTRHRAGGARARRRIHAHPAQRRERHQRNAVRKAELQFNVLRDLAPVASFMRVPNVMEVSPTLPVKTVPEFIAYAKANPGKVLFASSGVGTTLHMSGELFKAMAPIDIVHVPYRGLAAGGYADLMTGMVHVTFDNMPPSIELIRAGKLRALAVTSAARSQALPELPTVAEFLPGYEASAWYGIAAP